LSPFSFKRPKRAIGEVDEGQAEPEDVRNLYSHVQSETGAVIPGVEKYLTDAGLPPAGGGLRLDGPAETQLRPKLIDLILNSKTSSDPAVRRDGDGGLKVVLSHDAYEGFEAARAASSRLIGDRSRS
jgi:hypothetical protein